MSTSLEEAYAAIGRFLIDAQTANSDDEIGLIEALDDADVLRSALNELAQLRNGAA
jgi:hypothetical protein